MQSESKRLYDALNEEGLLKKQYGRKMTGDWEKDKASFLRQYEENEKLYRGDILDLDEDEDDDLFSDGY